jgi:type II secretory pathway pseudopilin PulG
MASDSINFLHSFLALSVVGVILTAALASYGGSVKQSSESKQLEDVLRMVGAKASYALMLLTENNASLILKFQIPTKIGDRYYWIRIANDSSSSWIEGGFGMEARAENPEYRVYLPSKVYATGAFESRYEIAQFNCSLEGSVLRITLGREE